MNESRLYTQTEQDQIRAAFEAGEGLTCPLCRIALDQRSVPPRKDVSYVRDRLLVVCCECHGTYVLDRKLAP